MNRPPRSHSQSARQQWKASLNVKVWRPCQKFSKKGAVLNSMERVFRNCGLWVEPILWIDSMYSMSTEFMMQTRSGSEQAKHLFLSFLSSAHFFVMQLTFTWAHAYACTLQIRFWGALILYSFDFFLTCFAPHFAPHLLLWHNLC